MGYFTDELQAAVAGDTGNRRIGKQGVSAGGDTKSQLSR